MFGNTGFDFKARIKRGAAIRHDHGYFSWPQCKPPGGGHEATDVDMIFEAEDCGKFFSLVAPGYGVLGAKGQYGNGSILVHGIDNLIVADADRQNVLARMRAALNSKISESEKITAKLRADLASLDQ